MIKDYRSNYLFIIPHHLQFCFMHVSRVCVCVCVCVCVHACVRGCSLCAIVGKCSTTRLCCNFSVSELSPSRQIKILYLYQTSFINICC